jgi:hypothetical protein
MADARILRLNNQSGRCLCGAVRFTAAPRERTFGACHCSMCRRWTGGPFLAVDCGDTVVIEDTASLGVYRSSAWAERCFCVKCGTVLLYRLVDKNHYFVSAEAFDDKDFAFTSQIFVDEKPPYYEFANATRNMTGPEVFAAFAASQGDGGKADSP